MSFWDLCTAVLVGLFPGLSSDVVCPSSFRNILIPGNIEFRSNVFIPDAFVQVGDPSILSYNPRFIRTFGLSIAHFTLAHEVGHIVFDHHKIQDNEVMQRQETQADCWAARLISEANPFAVEKTISYLKGLGTWYAEWHPSGTERAATVERCSSALWWQKFLFPLFHF